MTRVLAVLLVKEASVVAMQPWVLNFIAWLITVTLLVVVNGPLPGGVLTERPLWSWTFKKFRKETREW